MSTYNYIGLTGTQETDNDHAWFLTATTGVEGFALSQGEYIRYCRAMCMGAEEIFYLAGDNGIDTHVIAKSSYGSDAAIWETVLTGSDSTDTATGLIYEPVNDLLVEIRALGTLNVLDSTGIELWTFAGISSLWGIVSDADGYVYVVGDRVAGQLGEVNTASVWKLQWNATTVQYDVIAYYDTGGAAYGISIDSAGALLVCGVEVTSKNIWKLTAAMALTTDWLISGFDYLYSCEWLTTGNFAVGGFATFVGSHQPTVNQVQVINASTGAEIWGKLPSEGDVITYYIKTIGVDSTDDVHVIYGVEVLE